MKQIQRAKNNEEIKTYVSEEKQDNEIMDEYVYGIFDKRLKDFKEVLVDVENNMFKTKDE